MKILVIGTAAQQEELLAFPVSPGTELTWINRPGNVADYAMTDACIDLLFENDPSRIQWLRELNTSLVIINSVVTSLGEIQENFIRINGWNTFLRRPLIEAAGTDDTLKTKATDLFLSLGRQTEWVNDIPGFITPRVIACIINEAYMTWEEKVSVEEEIDTAMKLGTNYPFGPFEWGAKIGLDNVFHLLDALSKAQNRYQPALLLKQIALA